MLVCITNDTGSYINVGTEIPLYTMLPATGGTVHGASPISCGADGTNIYMNYSGGLASIMSVVWPGQGSRDTHFVLKLPGEGLLLMKVYWR